MHTTDRHVDSLYEGTFGFCCCRHDGSEFLIVGRVLLFFGVIGGDCRTKYNEKDDGKEVQFVVGSENPG